MRMRYKWAIAAAILSAAFIGGCTNVPYYLQSVRGQIDIWSRQHDIESLVAHPETAAPLREKLGTVLEIREYAIALLRPQRVDCILENSAVVHGAIPLRASDRQGRRSWLCWIYLIAAIKL